MILDGTEERSSCGSDESGECPSVEVGLVEMV